MKKKVLTIVLSLLLCMALPSMAFAGRLGGKGEDPAYPIPGGNIYYVSYWITDCDADIADVIIPSQINGEDVQVVSLNMWYFWDAYMKTGNLSGVKLRTLTIPATVKQIDFFEDRVPLLEEIKVDPANPNVSSDGRLWLKIDGNNKTVIAYLGNKNVTNYNIPSGITSIAENAFNKNYDLNNLTSITIPSSVYSIAETAFAGCDNITDIYYQGTAEQWAKLSVPTALSSANVHFNVQVNSNTSNIQSATSSTIKIMLNGSPLAFNEAPYMANGTTMVPMRVIFEALKADVNYDSATQKITATKGDTVIELVLGQKSAKKNGQAINLDVAATTRNGNTMVPLRFVAEALNAQVDWDNASQTVSITLAE